MTNAFDKLMGGLDEVASYLSGDGKGFQVHVPDEVDVKSIRQNLHMTQAGFSKTFGFSLDAVKHWEGNRRTPEIAARAYLTVIARAPQTVMQALSPHAAAFKARRVAKPSAGAPRNASRSRNAAQRTVAKAARGERASQPET
jgi:putative transcriptional regulator